MFSTPTKKETCHQHLICCTCILKLLIWSSPKVYRLVKSLPAFSPFPTMFSEGILPRMTIGIQNCVVLMIWILLNSMFEPIPKRQIRLFQTDGVCRRQFKINKNWQKVLQMGRKYCRKRRNCSLRAISPFPTVFSKDLFCRPVKTRACLGKG